MQSTYLRREKACKSRPGCMCGRASAGQVSAATKHSRSTRDAIEIWLELDVSPLSQTGPRFVVADRGFQQKRGDAWHQQAVQASRGKLSIHEYMSWRRLLASVVKIEEWEEKGHQ